MKLTGWNLLEGKEMGQVKIEGIEGRGAGRREKKRRQPHVTTEQSPTMIKSRVPSSRHRCGQPHGS